jgi:hypothetical protein
MDLAEGESLANIIEAIVTSIAILAAGGWAYYRFVHQREREPRAEFTVDLEFVGIQDNYWLVEVSAYVQNKGLVRHAVRDFRINVRYLTKEDKIVDGDEEILFQILLPHSIKERIGGKDRYLVKNGYIDPTIIHRNSYITAVPIDATFVSVFSRFEYLNEYHSAQKLFKVPGPEHESAMRLEISQLRAEIERLKTDAAQALKHRNKPSS